MLLRDATVEPTAQALENALGAEIYPVYRELLDIAVNEFGLEYGWRYYNDGKAWLCKVIHKKKTVFWLSIWEGLIKTSFFFTEKTRPGVIELPVSDEIKANLGNAKASGKLLSLILDIDRKEQLNDFRQIVCYKKNLK